jgi:tetratricopeptide (TPR) repeat protein
VSDVAQRLINRFPTDWRALYFAGNLYSRFGLSDQSKQLWNASLQLNPDDLETRVALGTLLFESGEFAQAEELLRIAYQQNRNPSVAYLLATTQLNQGHLDEAEKLLTSSLIESPDSFPCLLLLGQVLLQLKQAEAAKQRFAAASALVPDNPNTWFGIANACEMLGQSEDAARYRQKFNDLQQSQLLQEIEESRQHDAQIAFRQELATDCYLVGRFYAEKGNTEEAQNHWQLALQLNSDDANARYTLARLYVDQAKTDQALKVLLPLNHNSSTDANFWLQLGMVYSQLGAFDNADNAYLRLIELHPDLALGYAARCELRIRLRQWSAPTLELAQRAVQLQPNAENHYLLSVAAHHAGKSENARQAIQEAFRLDPQNVQYQQWYLSLQKSK